MHEIVFAKKVLKEAKEQGATHEIEVEVGELCEIEAHELKDALTDLTGWNIIANEKESKIKCKCGYIGRARIVDKGHGYCYFNCPRCSSHPQVLEGGEIKIVGVG